MIGYAARYSTDIQRDFRRGYSFAGWAIQPEATEEALRRTLVDHYGWSERAAGEIRVEHCGEVGGYLPAHDGLCAWFADTVREAVEQALADPRFSGMPLWVFRAEYLGNDPEDGTDIVRPLGRPHQIEKREEERLSC